MLDFLSGLAAPRLAELVAAHLPDGPEPVGRKALAKFAALLLDPGTVTETIAVLSLPELQVAEALSLRAAGTRRSDLARLLGVAADDADLGMVLGRLEWHALAWPDGEWIRTAPIHEVIVGGYGFGPSARIELTQLTIDRLQRIAYNLDAPVGRDRASLVDGVCAALADAATVRAKFAAAPEATKDLLLSLADDDPFYFDPRQMGALRTNRPTALRWAVDHGLIMWNPAGMAAVLPSEVGVVLRQGLHLEAGFRADFDPAPPLQVPVEVSVEMVERDGAAAIRAALAHVTALLEACGRAPVPMLKDGGVGIRELRRLSKAIGGDDLDMRLWLTLAGVSGLIGVTDNRIAPSAYYDDWLKLDPPAQYGELLTAWLMMDAAPLDTSSPALLRTQRDEAVSVLRRSLVSLLNGLPDGFALPSLEGINALQMYMRPLLTGADAEEAYPTTSMLWRELELMGLGALHAPTGLCRALAAEAGLDGTPRRSALLTALERLIPAAQRTVLLQSDLTAVATGAPAAPLAAFLDLAADRESRGGGHTWRFSEASVRRAFDTGSSADELLAALREAATGGRVPQPLQYLVTDLARRHGALRVRTVGCVLRSEDPTLLAELRRVKSLAKLGLTELAPTVYASALPAGETLAALRSAGYAPAGEHADGTIAFDRVTRHRVVRDQDKS
ncbi:helicase-associated domain-containing protein [Dactylosporangium sp. NBC_01737]|uniref:helicase-associated domain-containing protein n=1 Tax=Dactylosporangium sp. NBC_01737 TaxID=2975959 RepID=UPI002E0E21EF|nr:helicase-associated domain-containing protein [Dactylosporangium sp. NBC_01737]